MRLWIPRIVPLVAVCLLTLLTLPVLPATAQEGDPTPPVQTSPPSPPPPSPAPGASGGTASGPRVTAVRVERGHQDELPPDSPVQLDDHLVLTVVDYQEELDSGTDCFDLRLFLDGAPVTEPGPERCDENSGEIWFNVARIDRGKEKAWQNLIAKRDGLQATAAVSVGLKGGQKPIPTVAQGSGSLEFKLVHKPVMIVTAILLLLLLLLFLWLAKRSGILRASGPQGVPVTQRPFSLARVQMAWWFFLVIWAFFFITIISGNVAAIPASILGLMGISSGTFLGAEIIDSGKRQEEAEPTPAAGTPPAADPNAASAEAPTAGPAPPAPKRYKGLYGFFHDILSDATGVAFHRFQIVAFTLAIGLIFLNRVIGQLIMPEFDNTLLGLMGISSGTYIGAKFPETAKTN